MFNKLLGKLSQHPYDWVLHATMCFIPIFFELPMALIVVVVAFLIEFEQYNNRGVPRPASFEIYLIEDSMPDIIADFVGIVLSVGLLSYKTSIYAFFTNILS